MASNYMPEAVPAHLGTGRDRIIKRLTGNLDPYSEARSRANSEALRLLPIGKKFIDSSASDYDRFRRLSIVSIIANSLELDILGHEFSFSALRKMLRGQKLVVDDTRAAYRKLLSSRRVMLLTDNAGEIAFDTLLVRGIRSLGPSVTVAVKGSPVIDDALMEDALSVNMNGVADKIITTGTDTVGLIIDEAKGEFLEELRRCDFIVAKGMGHYETLTEERITQPILFMLRVKCNPVARSIGVSRGSNVALFRGG